MTEAFSFAEHAIEVPEIEGSVYLISDDEAVRREYAGLKKGDSVSLPFVMPYNVDVADAVAAGKMKRGAAQLRLGHGRHIHRTLDRGVIHARPGYSADRTTHAVTKGAGNSNTGRGDPAHWRWEANSDDDKEESVVGLCDISEASQDWYLSQRYNAQGGRFGVPAIIYEIPKLPVETGNGIDMLSVEEVRKMKLLPQFADKKKGESFRSLHTDFNIPVYYEKWYGSGVRLDDEFYMSLAATRLALQDTMRRLSEEDARLAVPERYAEWWARMQARNLALIHRDGLFHGSYHGGNLTLAGELTDLSGIFASSSLDHEESPALTQREEVNSMYEHVSSFTGTLQRVFDIQLDNAKLQKIAKEEYFSVTKRRLTTA